MNNKINKSEDEISSPDVPTVFISYNWGSSDFVDQIVDSLNDVASMHLDKKNIKTWGSITEFMKTIREQDFVVLVITDAYLRSIACLFEVMQLMKDEDWNTKTMYIVMDDARKIFVPSKQIEYIEHWNGYGGELETKIQKLPPDTTISLSEELRKAKIILSSIGDFMSIVADSNNPTPQNAIKEIYKRVANNRVNILPSYAEKTKSKLFSKCRNIKELLKKAMFELYKITATDYNQIILSSAIETHSFGLVVFADAIASHKQHYRIVSLQGLISKSYSQRVILNIPNVKMDINYMNAVTETQSELIVPIKYQNAIIGVFNSESEIEKYYNDSLIFHIEEVLTNFADKLYELGYRPNMAISELPYISINIYRKNKINFKLDKLINTKNLKIYMDKKFSNIWILPVLDHRADMIIAELNSFDIHTLLQLDELLNDDILQKIQFVSQESLKSTDSLAKCTYISALTFAMILTDPDKYYKKAWTPNRQSITNVNYKSLNALGVDVAKYGIEVSQY